MCKEADMIQATARRAEEETLTEPIPLRVRGSRSWVAGYPELVRAARAFELSTSFLARHWEELEPDTRRDLLRSIEATAYDVGRLLGIDRADMTVDEALADEALAARVASL
jgi:hypothetical protein